MAYRDGSYRSRIQTVSAGIDSTAFDNYNFAETRTDGALAIDNSVRFDPTNGRAEAAVTASLAGQGGCTSQVGQRIRIEGNTSNNLSIVVDANWRGILEIIGAGGSSMTMRALLIDDDGPLFPSVGSSSVIDSINLVTASANATDIGSPVVRNGSVFSNGSPSPLLATDISAGDVCRIIVYVQTTASVPFTFASARSDANSNGNNAFKGYIRLNALYFNWM